jgi:hypothetical protein
MAFIIILSYGFKEFRGCRGGHPVFGFTLSNEYDGFNTELGMMHTVQYQELPRFEYHPNNSEPYKVLLRRLGAEELDRRGW